MKYKHKYIGLILFLYTFFCFNIVNSMILDEDYSNNGKGSLLEVINNDIKAAYSISLLSIENLEYPIIIELPNEEIPNEEIPEVDKQLSYEIF